MISATLDNVTWGGILIGLIVAALIIFIARR